MVEKASEVDGISGDGERANKGCVGKEVVKVMGLVMGRNGYKKRGKGNRRVGKERGTGSESGGISGVEERGKKRVKRKRRVYSKRCCDGDGEKEGKGKRRVMKVMGLVMGRKR